MTDERTAASSEVAPAPADSPPTPPTPLYVLRSRQYLVLLVVAAVLGVRDDVAAARRGRGRGGGGGAA